MMILSEAISLTDFLRRRVRLLAEEGRVCVPFQNSSKAQTRLRLPDTRILRSRVMNSPCNSQPAR